MNVSKTLALMSEKKKLFPFRASLNLIKTLKAFTVFRSILPRISEWKNDEELSLFLSYDRVFCICVRDI